MYNSISQERINLLYNTRNIKKRNLLTLVVRLPGVPGSPRRTRRRLPGVPGSKKKKKFFFSKCLMEKILMCW